METYSLADLKRIERAIESPDLDYELWRSSRRRFVSDSQGVHVVHRDPHRGSFITGTGTELIYSNQNVGTAKNTFTTEAVINDVAGMGPQAVLPAYFFQPSGSIARTLKVIARGIYSTTSAPTWQVFTRLGGAASTAGANVGSTAATALGSTQTNLLWEYESEVQMVTPGGTGANSTMRGLGVFTAALTASTSVALGIFGGGASPGTVATVDISIVNYINFTAACGTSSASNSIQLLQLLIYGLN